MQAWELDRDLGKAQGKLNDIQFLLSEVCEDYGEDFCKEAMCDGDPGWEGCLTRKILGIIDGTLQTSSSKET